MRALQLFIALIGFASPTAALSTYIVGPQISTVTGRVTYGIAGKFFISDSSVTISTNVFTFDASSNTFPFLVSKSANGSLARFYNLSTTNGNLLDLITFSSDPGDYILQARSSNGNISGLLVRANGASYLRGPTTIGPSASINGSGGGLFSFGSYSSTSTSLRLYESGTNIYGLTVDGNNNMLKSIAGNGGGFRWLTGSESGVGIATMTQAGRLSVAGYVAAPQLAGGKLFPTSSLDVDGVGNVSDQINSSIGNFVKNAVLGSTGPVTAVVHAAGTDLCLFPGLTTLSNGVLMIVYHCSKAESPLTGQDGILKYKISTTSGTTWGAEQTAWNPGGLATQGVQDQEISAVVGSTVIASIFLTYASTSAVYVATGSVSGNAVSWNVGVKVTNSFTSLSATSGKAIWLQNNRWMLPIYGANTGEVGATAAVVFSDNGGVTWTGQVTVANGNGLGGYNEMNCIQQPTGRIVCIIRGAKGYSRAYSDDNGATWTGPALVLSTTVQGRPSLLLAQSTATILATRWDGLGSYEPSVYLTSWDYGLTWSPPKVLSNDTNDYSSIILVSSQVIGLAYGNELVNASSADIVYQTLVDPILQAASKVSGSDSNGYSLIVSSGIQADRFVGRMNVSSVSVAMNGFTSTALAFNGCISSLTITTNGGNVAAWASGDWGSSVGGGGCDLVILQDGSALDSAVLSSVVTSSASYWSPVGMYHETKSKPSVGAHTYCLGFYARVGGTCRFGAGAFNYFGVHELQ